MLEALRALRKQTRSLQEDRAVGKVITNKGMRERFGREVQAEFGWDGTNLKELFRIILENLPEILALILRLVK